jgi:hypothetical protein
VAPKSGKGSQRFPERLERDCRRRCCLTNATSGSSVAQLAGGADLVADQALLGHWRSFSRRLRSVLAPVIADSPCAVNHEHDDVLRDDPDYDAYTVSSYRNRWSMRQQLWHVPNSWLCHKVSAIGAAQSDDPGH